jgi:hypothetical protein
MIEVTYETLLDHCIVKQRFASTADRKIGVIGTQEYVYTRDGKMLGKMLREVNV